MKLTHITVELMTALKTVALGVFIITPIETFSIAGIHPGHERCRKNMDSIKASFLRNDDERIKQGAIPSERAQLTVPPMRTLDMQAICNALIHRKTENSDVKRTLVARCLKHHPIRRSGQIHG